MFCQIVLAMLAAVAPLIASPSLEQQSLPSATEASLQTPWPPVGVYRPGKDVKMPRIVKEEHPRYTAEAIRARIEGGVLVEAVVQTDGTVGEVRVKRSLDRQFGLDDEAVASVKKWKFTAGTKDDVAVPVLVEIDLTFSLKK